MECIEASSSTVASSTDSRAMDVSMTRPRWKKALSLGSTASSADTDRCTDLDELDLEALAADGVLTLNPKTGIYSGWVHVSTSGPGKVAFAKRFCRLEELVCKFYVSSEDAEQRAQPVGRHVIISVRRVHTHNKTFAFTDYEDRTVLLHTCIGADFEHWYGTFAAIIKATQVAKTHNSSATRRTTAFTPTARVGRNHRAAEERLRALTMPELNSPLNSTASDRPQGRELPPIAVDENDPERTHTVWLYIQAPWWRQLLRKRIRRYFVFSGANVSCFSVNKEGKRATFSHTITSCVYNSEQDATSIELEYGNTHRKLRLCGTNDGRNAVVATAKYIQNALELST
ncbi:hypothetical protein F441_01298 [Phytophthora nicotianae CJ01A1]|uniref:PH domain-containing protein n=6 Tax=Phytophthora nicotianae TaxID=4792 RepID=W2RHV7_PHYN3|nr:hypothetical protein PPTG_01129 [Phytophthora nicotianae INRA-310]ETI56056.1 hypothetical protein F443_01318 [Phytophthora nicotianae P1569]ETK95872.1 hypothetical protein L915_01243 [Phytophthora nicotianae]ETO84798.1 hypothetical protein F444_01322 [Phytophthora nicotianae P1976]ETP25863.1 hypothetical protein F441_01298 [Phytophthora nicotianae CJ01A1]ETP53870.1 hypothetical protein F442_01261 [Phytophthora nicotianae P10297]